MTGTDKDKLIEKVAREIGFYFNKPYADYMESAKEINEDFPDWLPLSSAPRKEGVFVQMLFYSDWDHLVVVSFEWLDEVWGSWDKETHFDDDYFIGWKPMPKPKE